MITIANYKKAESLEEAWELNQKRANKIIGGMLWLRMGKGRVGTAIDISGLGLDKIEETETEFSFGAMATLRDMEIHKGFNDYTDGAAKEAVRHIVGVQFRNLATIGGSIFGRFGFSDVLTFFLALESYVELYKGGRVSMREFLGMERDNDILVRVIVKKRNERCSYMSVRNSSTDFPVLTCAASLSESLLSVAVGARPGKAVYIDYETGADSDPEKIASDAADKIRTGSNMRASAQYRKKLAEVLVRRSADKLIKEVYGG